MSRPFDVACVLTSAMFACTAHRHCGDRAGVVVVAGLASIAFRASRLCGGRHTNALLMLDYVTATTALLMTAGGVCGAHMQSRARLAIGLFVCSHALLHLPRASECVHTAGHLVCASSMAV